MQHSNLLFILVCVCLFAGPAKARVGSPVKHETVYINGRKLRFEQSLPLIEKMLVSTNKTEVEGAVTAVKRWAWQLKGHPIMQTLAERYKREKDANLKIQLLQAIGGVGDPSTRALLKKESESKNELIKELALGGLAIQRCRWAVVALAKLMVTTSDPAIAAECKVLLFGFLDEIRPIEAFNFSWPAARKQRYFQSLVDSGIFARLNTDGQPLVEQ